MKIYIETLGCPKNESDSAMAAGILEGAGHVIVPDPCSANAVMVNTCGFINDAKKESIDTIFEMAQRKDEEAMLIVSGCLSERYKHELYEQMPEVDIFLGVNDYPNLPEILRNYTGKREKHFSHYEKAYFENIERKVDENPYSATVKIAEGCNNVCTYCVIPSIRGIYRSRKKEAILKEAEMLAEHGCKELILIAQDVTAYGMDLYGEFALPALLKALCKIDGIRWIRLMYCYEDRITAELIEVMREEEKICKYIDIPIQHCSDKILAAMNRRSTKKSIEKTLAKLRAAMPDIHIRTTLITGFPGENEDDFNELLDFVSEMRFERLGAFAYSKEEGTPAAKMKNQIHANTKRARQNAIMRRQLEISLKQNTAKIGRTFEVLVEGMDEEGAYYGRTRYDAPGIDNAVIFTAHKVLNIGDIINVKIVDAFDYDLVGMEE